MSDYDLEPSPDPMEQRATGWRKLLPGKSATIPFHVLTDAYPDAVESLLDESTFSMVFYQNGVTDTSEDIDIAGAYRALTNDADTFEILKYTAEDVDGRDAVDYELRTFYAPEPVADDHDPVYRRAIFTGRVIGRGTVDGPVLAGSLSKPGNKDLPTYILSGDHSWYEATTSLDNHWNEYERVYEQAGLDEE